MNNRAITVRAQQITGQFHGRVITDPDTCRALEIMAHTVLVSLDPNIKKGETYESSGIVVGDSLIDPGVILDIHG